MHVLLTNDDGVDAPWLSALAGGFKRAGHATSVLAPASDQSGMSGALQPLPIGGETRIALQPAPHVTADRAWGAERASPSVCVLLGLGGALDTPVDLVVSGPNYGWNIGRDVWRSGTAWAAITAWGMGLPALAVSGAPAAYLQSDLDALVDCTVGLAEELVAKPAPDLWNLNFPASPAEDWKPPEWTGLAPAERLTQSEVSVMTEGSNGQRTLRVSQQRGIEVPATPGSDSERVRSGGISLSQLRPLDAAG